jgi:hypothetical protein
MSNDHHDVQKWLPIDEVAHLLGTTPLNLLMHIKRGLLVGVEREDGWWIEPASLAELIRKQGEGQVPEVCQSGCAKKGGGCGSCS